MATQSASSRRSILLPAALVGAGLLVGGVFSEAVRPSFASAQQTVTEPPFNATEQRKQMIEQLRSLNDKVSAMQARLDKGLSVKVTEMPPVIVKDSGK